MTDLLPALIRLRDAMWEAARAPFEPPLPNMASDTERAKLRIEHSMSRLQPALELTDFLMANVDAIIDALTPKPPTDLAETVAELDRLLAEATPGPWSWWTSCSFRRLSSDATGKDGDVLHGSVQSDGVADITGSEADKSLIVAAVNALPFLLAAIKRRSEDAGVAELLRRVEERWPRGVLRWYYPGESDRLYWIAAVYVDDVKVARGEDTSRPAALRQLLGGSDD